MKNIAFTIVITGLLISCGHKSGSGHIITQNRETGSFTALSASGGFEVELTKGAAEKMVIEADDNLIKYIETKVVNDELRIRLDNI